MKKFIVTLSVICLMVIIFLTGCGDPRSNRRKPPSEALIAEDILAQNLNSFDIYRSDYNDYTFSGNVDGEMKISSVNIIKRKTDAERGEDTVNVSAEFENDNYSANAEFIFYYSYYDVGGWILDRYEEVNDEIFAKKSYYDEESFLSLLRESLPNGVITERDTSTSDDGKIFYDCIWFSGSVDYNYMSADITGYCSMEFCDNTWRRDVTIDNINVDWSKILGTWEYTHESGDSLIYTISDISINGNDYSLTRSYSSSAWKWTDKIYGENFVDYYCSAETKNDRFYDGEKIAILGTPTLLPTPLNDVVSLGGSYGEERVTLFTAIKQLLTIDANEGVILSVPSDGIKEGHEAILTKIN